MEVIMVRQLWISVFIGIAILSAKTLAAHDHDHGHDHVHVGVGVDVGVGVHSRPATYVQVAPPVALLETIPTMPYPNAYWIDGYWRWDDHWVWSPGYWTTRPQPNAVWVGGSWARHPVHNGWSFSAGYWR